MVKSIQKVPQYCTNVFTSKTLAILNEQPKFLFSLVKTISDVNVPFYHFRFTHYDELQWNILCYALIAAKETKLFEDSFGLNERILDNLYA